jgi:monoamine oxidase
MSEAEILIIGAGACGLMAARELAKEGKSVLVLEGQNRTGGRIHTIHDKNFLMPIEVGAEFIHGEAMVTKALLDEAGIKYYEMEGRMYHFRHGELYKDNSFIEHSRLLEKRMDELKEDMPLNVFLEKYFPEEKYNDLKEMTRGFVEGYDAADADKASTFAFRKEWSGNDMETNRIEGGYEKLIEYLKKKCEELHVKIVIDTPITDIKWGKNKVEAIDISEKSFHASKLIITVPPVLYSNERINTSINFSPSIPSKAEAAKQIGYGNVIKITLQFKEAFWKNAVVEKRIGESMDKFSFLLSDAFVPTWWTQYPLPVPILTGWLAGPKARKHKEASDEIILQEALHSLAFIFQTTAEDLEKKLSAWNVTNWAKNIFSLGAYSYATLESERAKKELKEPVESTIYFAGEALDDNGQSGTVEASLQDGKRVAEKVLGDEF